MGTLQIPFEIGQVVWHARATQEEVWVVCPDCAGSGRHRAILGNGDEVDIKCNRCGVGYQDATGRIKVLQFTATPRQFTCRRVRIDGADINYSEEPPESNCYSSVNANFLFATLEEAEARSKVLLAEREAEEAKRQEWLMQDSRRKTGFSIAYHQSQAREARKKLEYHEDKVRVLKEAKKEKAS